MKIIQTCIFLAVLSGALDGAAQKTRNAEELRVVLEQVQFSAGKSALRRETTWELDQVAALLKKSPSVTLEIDAHTDASGSAPYNLRLSQQRAQAAAAYLVNKGIASKRLRAVGYGETKPINRCKRGTRCTEAEKRQNRRLELRVKGLPENEALRARWLELNGFSAAPSTPMQTAQAPENTQAPYARVSPGVQTANPAPSNTTTDFFPELSDASRYVPQPLPGTFAGYTVEIACADRPLAAGHPTLRKYDPVFLRRDAAGRYCYYIGAFHTLPEANDFLRGTALPLFVNARVTAFLGEEKTYFTPQNR